MLDTLASASDLESVDLVIRLLELLADSPSSRGVSDVARALDISKARAHRHLRALVRRGYVRQDPRSEAYEVGVKLLALGEAVRDRFDVARVARPLMGPLREATGFAVTVSALVEGEVAILDMLQGKTLIDFAIRPGARLALHASAHGLVTLAFGPPALAEAALARPLQAWTSRTLVDAGAVRARVAQVRSQGWATAADGVQVGVNALAAPIFDHRAALAGALALVGSTHLLPDRPSEPLVGLVTAAAAVASRALGWEARRP